MATYTNGDKRPREKPWRARVYVRRQCRELGMYRTQYEAEQAEQAFRNPSTLISVGEDWRENAACKGMDVNLFFPEDPNEYAVAAQRICKECPVQEPCRQYAIENFEHGVWGGTGPSQRETLRRRQERLGSYNRT